MNGITIILVSAVVLIIGYLGYGRWLANQWGVDKNALTPAVRMEDGKNFSPASRFTVFAHQFSSICGAGPVTGTIVAMAFGWVPVMLWVLVGGIFFGAVHDFGALYASMKNNGKSLAQLIEKYIGKTGRRLFLLFSWLFCLIVIAAFTSMVAGTFKMTVADGGAVDYAKSYYGGAAGTISLLFTFVAILFGWACRKFDLKGWKELVCAVVLLVLMFAVGMQLPLYLDENGWIAVTMAYLVFAAAMPIQTLKQPRDYLTTIMMVVMIVAAVLGIFVMGANGQGEMTAPAFVGFTNASGQFLFPVLFVSVACGALATPFQIFAAGIAKGMTMCGLNQTVSTVFMTMCVSALALTSLDAVARIARLSFQEFFAKSNDALAVEREKAGVMKVVGNPWFATIVTLVCGLSLTFGGYLNIWPLFGASNQLLGGMTMITIAVFCKVTGRKGWMLYVPVVFLLCCTFTSLVQSIMGCTAAIATYGLLGTTAKGASVLLTSGLQLVFAVLLVVLGVIVSYNCLKEFFTKKAGSIPDEEPEWSELGRKHYEEAKKTPAMDAKKQVTA